MQNSDNFKRPLTVSMNGNWKLKGPFKKVVCMHALYHEFKINEILYNYPAANCKAMKSSPLLGPFCGSEFW